MKKLCQLSQEAQEKGIPIPEGMKVSKEYLIQKLAEYHLQYDPRGIPPLEQISPQLANDIQDISEEEKKEVLKSDRYSCGEKINGVRGIFHIRPEGIRITGAGRSSRRDRACGPRSAPVWPRRRTGRWSPTARTSSTRTSRRGMPECVSNRQPWTIVSYTVQFQEYCVGLSVISRI